MAIINVSLENTVEEWRVKTNDLGSAVGDINLLDGSYGSSDLVSVVNEIRNDAQFDSPLQIVNGGVLSTTAAALEFTVNSQVQLTTDANGDSTATRDLIATRNVSGVDVTASDQLSGNSLSVALNAGIGGALSVTNGCTVAGTASFTGNVLIGNDSTDVHVITGDINSSIIPEIDSTHDLGTTSKRWSTAFVDTLNAGTAITTAGTLTVAGNAVVDGTLTVDGGVILGDAVADGHTINGTVTHNNWIRPAVDNSQTIGASNLRYNNIHSVTFTGTATAAQYADLAEKYLADAEYEVGTVMAIGGEKEVTAATSANAHSVVGVVSDKPAYLMNKDLEGGTTVALKGRVPVRIANGVNKGDRLVASETPGLAEANNAYGVHSFAIALEDSHGDLVEAVIL